MTLPKLPDMKAGLIISACLHAALLAWGLISFVALPLEAKPTDALPVDIITTSEFSQLTAGVKNAPKVETPKPLADKVGEQKPVEEIKPKVVDKPEVKTAAAPPPEQQPAPEQPKPDPKPPEKKPEPKIDPIAEKLKKEEQQRKIAEAKAKAEAKKKQQQEQPKFDPNQIAALLDKRDATRPTATGDMLAPPSLGIPGGVAPKLSQNELDAMRAKLMQLWSPPVGVAKPEELIVKIRIRLKRDGTLADWPIVLATGKTEHAVIARENAVRAIIRGQPFTMLSQATYETWKEIEITFDPRDMFRG